MAALRIHRAVHGTDVPDELRSLPPGQYVISTTDEAPVLTAEEEAGLAKALKSLDRGEGIAHGEVMDRVGKLLRR